MNFGNKFSTVFLSCPRLLLLLGEKGFSYFILDKTYFIMWRWCRTHFLFLERVGCILLMPLGLAVATRGKELHRVSHAHAALFVTAGEKARSSRVVAGLPDSARRRSCRRSRSQSQRHRGSLNSARSRVRATMPFERAHAMFLHALIVVCAMCSASAPPQQVLLLGRLSWLRRARPPRSSAGCVEPDGALVAAWHVHATQPAAWSWANPKHDALLSRSPVISYLCDDHRQRWHNK